jgi:hypothetical protein
VSLSRQRALLQRIRQRIVQLQCSGDVFAVTLQMDSIIASIFVVGHQFRKVTNLMLKTMDIVQEAAATVGKAALHNVALVIEMDASEARFERCPPLWFVRSTSASRESWGRMDGPQRHDARKGAASVYEILSTWT